MRLRLGPLSVVALAALAASSCGDDGRRGPDAADGRDDWTGEVPDAPDGDGPADGGDGTPEADAGDARDEHVGPCTTDEQCQDESWCNGWERCDGEVCVAGADPCDDRVDCTVDSCDEETDRCYHTPDNEFCSDGDVCTGEEQCLPGDPGSGCHEGYTPDCRDEDTCTIDQCIPERGGCVHDPRDIDRDGYFAEMSGVVVCGGDDCNDGDSTVHPGADEVCTDMRDNDCDGDIDFADAECRPENDTCAAPTILLEGERVSASTRGTRDDFDISCGSDSFIDVVFTLTLDELKDLVVNVAGVGLTLNVEIRSACEDAGTSVYCGTGSSVAARKNSLPPGTYWIIVKTSREGDFTIEYTTGGPTPIPPNDRCDGAEDIPPTGGVVTGTLFDTGPDYTPTCGSSPAYADAFYRLVLTEPKKIAIELQMVPAVWSTYLALTTVCGAPASQIACASGSTPRITRNFLNTGTYYIVVDSANATPFNLTVTFDDPIYPPPNDTCTGAVDLPGGGVVAGTLMDTYRDYPPSCSTLDLSDVVYAFTTTAPQDVHAMVAPIGSSATYALAMRSVCDDAGSEIYCRSGTVVEFTRRSVPAGTYYLIVSGPATGANRFVFQLEILPPTPMPANDICMGATDVSAGGRFTGSTVGCEDDYTPACGSGIAYPDIVYTFDLTEPHDVTLDLSSRAPTAYLDLRRDPCGAALAPSVGCTSGAAPSVFTRSLEAGAYWILVDTSIETATTLNVAIGPPTTACSGASTITVDYSARSTYTTSVSGSTAGRPLDFAGSCAGSGDSPDVPYLIEIPVRSTFWAEVIAGTFDTALHMRSACDDPATELACDDDGGSGLLSRVPTTGTLTLGPGTYTLVMDGYWGGSGTYTLQINATRI